MEPEVIIIDFDYSYLDTIQQTIIDQNRLIQGQIDTIQIGFYIFIGLFIAAIVALIFFKVVSIND